jgi:hypothetical protein
MSTPTLGMSSQVNDSFNYAVLDALGDSVPQNVNLSNFSKMVYGQTSNSANGTTTVPTKFYLATKTITIASSTLDIDLTLLVDIFGNVLNFAKIYEFFAHNNDASGGSGVILKPAPSNGWTGIFNGSSSGQILVPAGGECRLTAPYAGYNVTAGSKVLRLQNDAASPTGALSITLAIAGG